MPTIKISVVYTEKCPMCKQRVLITRAGKIRMHYASPKQLVNGKRVKCGYGRSA